MVSCQPVPDASSGIFVARPERPWPVPGRADRLHAPGPAPLPGQRAGPPLAPVGGPAPVGPCSLDRERL